MQLWMYNRCCLFIFLFIYLLIYFLQSGSLISGHSTVCRWSQLAALFLALVSEWKSFCEVFPKGTFSSSISPDTLHHCTGEYSILIGQLGHMD